MASAVRSIGRFLLIVSILAIISPAPSPARSSTPQSAAGEQPQAGMYPEVRLRKLHLVRPDLIPYPIAYEVCC
jgi:hypothetical protein